MIKAGIIGCGKIADQHAGAIQSIPECEIVGVCDTEELMAKQLYERFKAKYYFSDINKLLESAHPDVVHITTPPQSHFELARVCLEAGCHIYVEKPFTLNTTEAEELINFATKKNLKITVGHDAQFTPAALRMRKLIQDGFLGGPPVHMESLFCYDFGDQRYVKAFLGDETHWLRTLPGKLLQNIISHGISKIAEFIKDDYPKVIAYGFNSPLIKSLNETQIIDELRTIIYDDSTTAYFTFSSQMNPIPHQFRLYGKKNSLIVDDDNQTLIKFKGGKCKSYLNYFIPPFIYAKQYITNSLYNMNKFIKSDFHTDYGMRYLIKAFYHSISDNAPLPMTYKEILITSRIMDSIFSQINCKS
jgi:predicted dehydrogenase